MKEKSKVFCPNCNYEIDVESIISHQLEEKYNQDYRLKLAEVEKRKKELLLKEQELTEIVNIEVSKKISSEKYRLEDKLRKQLEEENIYKFEVLNKELSQKTEQVKELNRTKAELEKIRREKEELRESIEAEAQKKINYKLIFEREKIQREEKSKNELAMRELRKQLEEENIYKFEVLNKELSQKTEQIKELNRTKAELEKTRREKEELRESIEAEAQKKINDQLILEREKIQREEKNKNELAMRELQKQLEDQKKLTEEMKRKQEQGSMQLQGEVQELAIEEWLKENFPLDTIDEVKKGDRGADCIQIVNTRTKQNCGMIYYESKRTKEFNQNWIEKFKNDIREKGANVGVLVTDAFPKGQERLKLIDGVWVCSYEEFKGLCFVLRDGIVQLSSMISSQENKGDKMIMLYDFLTSNEFKMQVEGIVEGFTQMYDDLISEKRAIQGHWKKREKQIQKVLLNTNHMYNSIKGIAGNAIQPIKTLELPEQNQTR